MLEFVMIKKMIFLINLFYFLITYVLYMRTHTFIYIYIYRLQNTVAYNTLKISEFETSHFLGEAESKTSV